MREETGFSTCIRRHQTFILPPAWHPMIVESNVGYGPTTRAPPTCAASSLVEPRIYCPPRHQSISEPSSFELNGIV